MMRNKILLKVTSLVVSILFLTNELCYGLAVEPGSRRPPVQADMYALGQKLFAAKIGPGAIDFERYLPGIFTGKCPAVEGVKFIKTDYENSPKEWRNNPILRQTDLIRTLRYFRKHEARIPAKQLQIIEGYFPVSKGEFPLARIEKIKYMDYKYVLVVHSEFVQMWNHIRKNDIWFEYTFPDGKTRVVSLAWAIFYRLAKHEMGDIRKDSDETRDWDDWSTKSRGHLVTGLRRLNWRDPFRISVPSEPYPESFANETGSRYRIVNDSIWLWFLASYCFKDTTRYNNNLFRKRVRWILDGRNPLRLYDEFPNLRKDTYGYNPFFATQLAMAVNYHFFSRRNIKVPKTRVSQAQKDRYLRRIKRFSKVFYATGGAPAEAPVPEGFTDASALKESIHKYLGLDAATLTRLAKERRLPLRQLKAGERQLPRGELITALIAKKHGLVPGDEVVFVIQGTQGSNQHTVIYEGIVKASRKEKVTYYIVVEVPDTGETKYLPRERISDYKIVKKAALTAEQAVEPIPAPVPTAQAVKPAAPKPSAVPAKPQPGVRKTPPGSTERLSPLARFIASLPPDKRRKSEIKTPAGKPGAKPKPGEHGATNMAKLTVSTGWQAALQAIQNAYFYPSSQFKNDTGSHRPCLLKELGVSTHDALPIIIQAIRTENKDLTRQVTPEEIISFLGKSTAKRAALAWEGPKGISDYATVYRDACDHIWELNESCKTVKDAKAYLYKDTPKGDRDSIVYKVVMATLDKYPDNTEMSAVFNAVRAASKSDGLAAEPDSGKPEAANMAKPIRAEGKFIVPVSETIEWDPKPDAVYPIPYYIEQVKLNTTNAETRQKLDRLFDDGEDERSAKDGEFFLLCRNKEPTAIIQFDNRTSCVDAIGLDADTFDPGGIFDDWIAVRANTAPKELIPGKKGITIAWNLALKINPINGVKCILNIDWVLDRKGSPLAVKFELKPYPASPARPGKGPAAANMAKPAKGEAQSRLFEAADAWFFSNRITYKHGNHEANVEIHLDMSGSNDTVEPPHSYLITGENLFMTGGSLTHPHIHVAVQPKDLVSPAVLADRIENALRGLVYEFDKHEPDYNGPIYADIWNKSRKTSFIDALNAKLGKVSVATPEAARSKKPAAAAAQPAKQANQPTSEPANQEPAEPDNGQPDAPNMAKPAKGSKAAHLAMLAGRAAYRQWALDLKLRSDTKEQEKEPERSSDIQAIEDQFAQYLARINNADILRRALRLLAASGNEIAEKGYYAPFIQQINLRIDGLTRQIPVASKVYAETIALLGSRNFILLASNLASAYFTFVAYKEEPGRLRDLANETFFAICRGIKEMINTEPGQDFLRSRFFKELNPGLHRYLSINYGITRHHNSNITGVVSLAAAGRTDKPAPNMAKPATLGVEDRFGMDSAAAPESTQYDLMAVATKEGFASERALRIFREGKDPSTSYIFFILYDRLRKGKYRGGMAVKVREALEKVFNASQWPMLSQAELKGELLSAGHKALQETLRKEAAVLMINRGVAEVFEEYYGERECGEKLRLAVARVNSSMAKIPRHIFVPKFNRKWASMDRALHLPMGHGQTISQPSMVQMMTVLLDLKKSDRVLEAGAGSGYQAAILGKLAGKVCTVDVYEDLVSRAKQACDNAGIRNIEFYTGDATKFPGRDMFDAICVSAGAPDMVRPLLDRLRVGGRMVIPIAKKSDDKGNFYCDLTVIIKTADGTKTFNITSAPWVPLIGENGHGDKGVDKEAYLGVPKPLQKMSKPKKPESPDMAKPAKAAAQERPAEPPVAGSRIEDVSRRHVPPNYLADHRLVNALISMITGYCGNTNNNYMVTKKVVTEEGKRARVVYLFGDKETGRATFRDIFTKLVFIYARRDNRKDISPRERINDAKLAVAKRMVTIAGREDYKANVDKAFVKWLETALSLQIEHFGVRTGKVYTMKKYERHIDQIVRHVEAERAHHRIAKRAAFFRGEISYDSWRQGVVVPQFVSLVSGQPDVLVRPGMTYKEFVVAAADDAEYKHPLGPLAPPVPESLLVGLRRSAPPSESAEYPVAGTVSSRPDEQGTPAEGGKAAKLTKDTPQSKLVRGETLLRYDDKIGVFEGGNIKDEKSEIRIRFKGSNGDYIESIRVSSIYTGLKHVYFATPEELKTYNGKIAAVAKRLAKETAEREVRLQVWRASVDRKRSELIARAKRALHINNDPSKCNPFSVAHKEVHGFLRNPGAFHSFEEFGDVENSLRTIWRRRKERQAGIYTLDNAAAVERPIIHALLPGVNPQYEGFGIRNAIGDRRWNILRALQMSLDEQGRISKEAEDNIVGNILKEKGLPSHFNSLKGVKVNWEELERWLREGGIPVVEAILEQEFPDAAIHSRIGVKPALPKYGMSFDQLKLGQSLGAAPEDFLVIIALYFDGQGHFMLPEFKNKYADMLREHPEYGFEVRGDSIFRNTLVLLRDRGILKIAKQKKYLLYELTERGHAATELVLKMNEIVESLKEYAKGFEGSRTPEAAISQYDAVREKVAQGLTKISDVAILQDLIIRIEVLSLIFQCGAERGKAHLAEPYNGFIHMVRDRLEHVRANKPAKTAAAAQPATQEPANQQTSKPANQDKPATNMAKPADKFKGINFELAKGAIPLDISIVKQEIRLFLQYINELPVGASVTMEDLEANFVFRAKSVKNSALKRERRAWHELVNQALLNNGWSYIRKDNKYIKRAPGESDDALRLRFMRGYLVMHVGKQGKISAIALRNDFNITAANEHLIYDTLRLEGFERVSGTRYTYKRMAKPAEGDETKPANALLVMALSEVLQKAYAKKGNFSLEDYRAGYNEIGERFPALGFSELPEIKDDMPSKRDLYELFLKGIIGISSDGKEYTPHSATLARLRAIFKEEIEVTAFRDAIKKDFGLGGQSAENVSGVSNQPGGVNSQAARITDKPGAPDMVKGPAKGGEDAAADEATPVPIKTFTIRGLTFNVLTIHPGNLPLGCDTEWFEGKVTTFLNARYGSDIARFLNSTGSIVFHSPDASTDYMIEVRYISDNKWLFYVADSQIIGFVPGSGLKKPAIMGIIEVSPELMKTLAPAQEPGLTRPVTAAAIRKAIIIIAAEKAGKGQKAAPEAARPGSGKPEAANMAKQARRSEPRLNPEMAIRVIAWSRDIQSLMNGNGIKPMEFLQHYNVVCGMRDYSLPILGVRGVISALDELCRLGYAKKTSLNRYKLTDKGREAVKEAAKARQKDAIAGTVSEAGAVPYVLNGKKLPDDRGENEPSVKPVSEEEVVLRARYAKDKEAMKSDRFIKVISTYVIPGFNKGPGVVKLPLTELKDIYEAIDLLHGTQVEIILPKSVGISADSRIKKAIRDAHNRRCESARRSGRQEEKDQIILKTYDGEEGLKGLLKNGPDKGVYRIVITDKQFSNQDEITDYLAAFGDLTIFDDVRLLNIKLPEGYADLKDDDEKTFHQARLIMIAVLARLVNSKNEIGRAMLQAMLENYIEGDAEEFTKNLIRADSSWDKGIAERLGYFLGRPVSLLKRFLRDFEMLRLRMKTFWIAA